MSEITISLEQIESYIKTLSGDFDEWWMPEYDLYGNGLIDFLKTVDKSFGDEANALLKLHGIEADDIRRKEKDKQQVADDEYRAIGTAPIKIEGERCII
tara:strand:+ start:557 stop:853 length:297 start_codon:yes stop_codon:yes gene_type:complete